MNGAFIATIFNKQLGPVTVSSNQPDSLRAGGARRVGNAAISVGFVVTAFPLILRPSQNIP
jgi:hypothetical protein